MIAIGFAGGAQVEQKYRHVFGPVLSRRLGRSLGVDIVSSKVCTFNCVYCEAGLTTNLTNERREYVPVEDLLSEVEQRLREGVGVDCVTITGSGEPTLHSGLGRIIAGVRKIAGVRVAVLTNGSLLGDVGVQNDLLEADLVMPSMDASTDDELRSVNRPCKGITVDAMVNGLTAFRARFKGEIWLEILLVAGLNDSEDSIRRLADIARKVSPDRVQLNTVVRPPALSSAGAVPYERLLQFAQLFTPSAEVIAPSPVAVAAGGQDAVSKRGDILDMLRRRPCPLEEIAAGIGVGCDAAMHCLATLEREGLVGRKMQGSIEYFVAKP